ncbi:PREDICTED: uncharacterized protein LOC106815332, partial [Priapulus caudatus]|uniref:Uncharacterized protein LOC106815332 n=1 Tax=Priapulus caudatus TaxID=37621 RepID=A0ABM1ESU2_PRICU
MEKMLPPFAGPSSELTKFVGGLKDDPEVLDKPVKALAKGLTRSEEPTKVRHLKAWFFGHNQIAKQEVDEELVAFLQSAMSTDRLRWKLDSRGVKGIFVGYDKGSPAYLVYMPILENKKDCIHLAVPTTEVSSDEEPIPLKRTVRKKTFSDCVTESMEASGGSTSSEQSDPQEILSMLPSESTLEPLQESAELTSPPAKKRKQLVPKKALLGKPMSQTSTSGSATQKSPASTRRSTAFPMSDAKFQRKVLYMLSEIRSVMKNVKSHEDPEEPEFHVEQVSTLEALMQWEKELKTPENRQLVISQLSRIGGVSLRDNVNKVLHRIMSNKVVAQINMKGAKGKLALAGTELFSIVT